MMTDKTRRLPMLWLLASCFASLLGAQTGEKPQYEFTVDWVSNNVELWNRHLGEFRGKADVRALEIGSYEGRSALWFLEEILTHPTARITCIDLFEVHDIEARFDRNLEASGLASKVEKIKGDSQSALRRLAEHQFDFIYIDGSHDAKDVLLDTALSWGLLKDGGLLIFDDYRLRLEWHPARRPKMAIDAFLEVFEPYVEVVHSGYQVIVRKRLRSELAPLPARRTLGGWDFAVYLISGLLVGAVSCAIWQAKGLAAAVRILAATVGAAGAGWAYAQEFKAFGQLKEVAGFNAFSTLGTLLPALAGAVLALVLLWIAQRLGSRRT